MLNYGGQRNPVPHFPPSYGVQPLFTLKSVLQPQCPRGGSLRFTSLFAGSGVPQDGAAYAQPQPGGPAAHWAPNLPPPASGQWPSSAPPVSGQWQQAMAVESQGHSLQGVGTCLHSHTHVFGNGCLLA